MTVRRADAHVRMSMSADRRLFASFDDALSVTV